jgi:hypothetical protein
MLSNPKLSKNPWALHTEGPRPWYPPRLLSEEAETCVFTKGNLNRYREWGVEGRKEG